MKIDDEKNVLKDTIEGVCLESNITQLDLCKAYLFCLVSLIAKEEIKPQYFLDILRETQTAEESIKMYTIIANSYNALLKNIKKPK
jgi:hypothetical protein